MKYAGFIATSGIVIGLGFSVGWAEVASGHGEPASPTLSVHSQLRDLVPAAAHPTDGVRSHLDVSVRGNTTTVLLRLDGFSSADAGRRFGAHLHTGPCVAGNGAAAGPHYNNDVINGVPAPAIGPDTEIWLDFEVRADGSAQARATVPFAVLPGDRAVVIHAEETLPNGTAGPRLACAPAVW